LAYATFFRGHVSNFAMLITALRSLTIKIVHGKEANRCLML
jgi:hypothetical protein